MMRSLLEVTDVVAGYGQAMVLHGVSLCVQPGELVAILGRNGMGKTTLVRTIFGLVRAMQGSICLEGKEIHRLHPHEISRRGLGLVPQGRRVFSSLSVEANLALAWRGRAGAWTPSKILDLFPRLALRRKTLAGYLSGGEQQMLAIGRALVGNPKLLVLDEPSEGLAPIVVEEVREVLQDLKRRGMSILLVEQSVELALDLADRVYVLENGAMAYESDTASARAQLSGLRRYLSV